jgi:hypothetical protein
MRRITPAEIIRAYESTKLQPTQRVWFDAAPSRTIGETQWCGCGLTALALAAGLPERQLLRRDVGAQALAVLAVIAADVTESFVTTYAFGFYKGFDGARWEAIAVDYEDYEEGLAMLRDGYSDGVHAWQAVATHFAL